MTLEYYVSKIIRKLRFKAVKDSQIDKTAHIASGCHVFSSSIGRYSAVSYDCQLIHCQIGAFCSLASGIIIGGASHPMDWVSMSQVFVIEPGSIKKKFSPHEYESYKKTIIGNDVWIGDRVLIKAGVTIGTGSVIGMGSVVTKDIGDYEIWAGNPAKLIRHRFDEETKERLLASRWWELPETELKEESNSFNNITAFLSKGHSTRNHI